MVSCSFFVSRLLYLTVITAYSKLIQIPKGKYTKYPWAGGGLTFFLTS